MFDRNEASIDPAGGLTTAEAARRLAEHGPNRLPEAPVPGPLALFARQFLNPFIYILAGAAAASIAVGHAESAVFIGAVLLINALIGTVQEHGAQRAAAALRDMVRGRARVLRDGRPVTVDVEEVVPGDAVLLSSGDKIPADLRLAETQDFTVDESMLTGESLAVPKDARARSVEGAPPVERRDMAFAGAAVVRGRAVGVATATGTDTAIGDIARAVGESVGAMPPLMTRIHRFTLTVAGGIGVAILILIALMVARGGYDGSEMVMMAIGLAVSTIPEGLPAALTVALAIGMRRMAERNVIIRRLVAVEALGSCTFIASDKTGTLTVNELTIRRVALPGGAEFEVTGEGVAPGGEVRASREERLRELAVTGVLANESHLDYAGGDWASDGDIVDVAFLVLAKKLGMRLSEVREAERLELIPYESERAMSAALHGRPEAAVLHVKGSPEKMLELCETMLTEAGEVPVDRAALTAQFEGLAAQGYRLIALARRVGGEGAAADRLGAMTFLGMVAMIDPVRPAAREAVRSCRAGGIEVAMVTGDHPATARAIGADLGLCGPEDPVVTGTDLRAVADDQAAFDALVRPARVFARIEPVQKERIVDSFIRGGHFVAVTGDGVNDAPALRRANAGVAMGRGGTDVAREAADLILTDDDFASIVRGIEQGRVVYANIRKVIGLLVATGVSALLLFALTVLFGLPMPLTAVQLLWLNLVANGLQDVALAFEPAEGGELDRKPRRPDEPIFDGDMIRRVTVNGLVMGGLAFALGVQLHAGGAPVEEVRNLVLLQMILFGNVYALACRSEIKSAFSLPLRRNLLLALAVPGAQLIHLAAAWTPWLSDVLQIAPVTAGQWIELLAFALILLGVDEGLKAVLRGRARAGARTA